MLECVLERVREQQRERVCVSESASKSVCVCVSESESDSVCECLSVCVSNSESVCV